MNTLLQQLKNKDLVWNASRSSIDGQVKAAHRGYPELDNALSQGMPCKGLIDIQSAVGIGEIRLFLPYIHARQQEGERYCAFISPPYQPNAEMLVEQQVDLSRMLLIPKSKHILWAAEQCLKSGNCHSVMLWCEKLETHQVKRLQLAADQGDCLLFIYRKVHEDNTPLPVSLSLKISAIGHGLRIHIVKQRKGWPRLPFDVDMQSKWPTLTQPMPANNVVAWQPRHAGTQSRQIG